MSAKERTTSQFSSEAEMVDQFIQALNKRNSQFGKLEIMREWDHRSGLVDVLARDRGEALLAFEAKLKDWKRAFLQAYRSTAYANRSYVLLPTQVAQRAMAHKREFEFRGVGLCSFDGNRVDIVIDAVEQAPLMSWLRSKAHAHFNGAAHEYRARSCRSSSLDLSAAAA